MSADLLDIRQRMAATCLLSAFDLPAPLHTAAKQWGEAAAVCPGVALSDIQAGLGEGQRLILLRRAQHLIDELVRDEGG